MNTVVIDGVTYTKAGILAKEFRYTTDYIGQLCRGGKVDAQLVGRSWYVSEDSLRDYSSKRIEAIRQDEIILENNLHVDGRTQVVKVSAPLSKITKKMLRDTSSPERVGDTYSSTRYEADPVDLLPVMKVRPVTPTISIQKESTLAPKSSSSPESGSNLAPKQGNSYSVPINQKRVVAIKPSVPSLPSNTPISTHSPKIIPINQPQMTKSPVPHKAVSFTPSSIVVPTPVRKVPYGVLTLGILLFATGAVLTALMLDIEVYYDGTITSTSFSINQNALLSFFKDF